MRIALYTDVHFSEYSSIVRSQGSEYSSRLENLINSVSWAEATAVEQNCTQIICLGDFFDRPDLNSRELTALNEIKWVDLPHTFIVGNHEASSKSLKYNSVTALKNNGFEIIDKPTAKPLVDGNNILFVPYLLDEDRRSIKEYIDSLFLFPKSLNSATYVFSHNDIKGIRYGMYESKNGFEINDIEANCNLFLNGHLHNGTKFCKNGINLGNLTGQNFSEDASVYSHCMFILDTAAQTLDAIENPFAFNFYKLTCINSNDLNQLDSLKNNAVLSIKCSDTIKDELLKKIDSHKNIKEHRVMYIHDDAEEVIVDISDLTMDHLAKFVEFCKEKIENSDILTEELNEVCK